ncbi:MAG: hypothetical protein R3C03_09325 [Pirellulaceae bacterium]
MSSEMADLFDKFEAVEQKLADAKPGAEALALEKERASILYQLILAKFRN